MPEFLGCSGKVETCTDPGDYRRVCRMDGSSFSVPHVENLSKPRLLLLEREEFEYEPVAVTPWQRVMHASADKFGRWMEEELADKFDHAARRGRA